MAESANSLILTKKSYITKTKGFGLLVLTFLAIKVLFALLIPDKHLSFASDLTTDNILKAVNKERALRNLVTLNTNTMLGMAAQSKADDMTARKYFAHVDPDGHYIWDKIVADGYSPYIMLGENLAIEFYDTDSLMSAWMNSPTHRANILQEGFKDQGMGLTFGNVADGQYHSAIANTFGALAISTKPPKVAAPATQATTPPAAKPKTTTKKKTPVKQNTLGTEQTAVPTPTPTALSPTPTAPASTLPTTEPIKIRESDQLAVNQQSGFALPSGNSAVQTAASQTPEKLPVNTSQSASAVIGNLQSATLTDYQTNRYLILVCGIVLLLLMLSDIRIAIEKKFGSLDKKINNFVLLFISLIVIAFMYWL